MTNDLRTANSVGLPDSSPDCPRCAALTRELAEALAGADAADHFYRESVKHHATKYLELQAQTEALSRDLAQARQALQRAAYIAEHLHVMIDQDTWRATGGDDSQGHYEGDYHAKQLLTEIRGLAALAAREALVERGTEQTDLGGDETPPVMEEGQA